jgi:hypothetical protein
MPECSSRPKFFLLGYLYPFSIHFTAWSDLKTRELDMDDPEAFTVIVAERMILNAGEWVFEITRC